ncbi:MAG: Xaa-Pro peptidase family protein [Thermomicrobiales bacterium]
MTSSIISPPIIAARRDVLVAAMHERGATMFLSEAIPDIRYYTGCMDAGGVLLIDRDGQATFLTNAHDAPQAMAEAIATEIGVSFPNQDASALLADALASTRGPILTPALAAGRQVWLIARGHDIRMEPGITSHLRRVKEPGELSLIRQAARIVETGMAAARDALRPGITEIEVAAQAELAMRRAGMDGRIFETKVESGPRSAMPSTYAGHRVLAAGDLVLIDIGPTLGGYFGDLTRTFAVGDPSPEGHDLLQLVLTAQAAGIDAVRAGTTGHDVDEAARVPVRSAGHEGGFRHNTGHSLGLAGDSLPLIAPGNRSPLRAGECITVEPGVYVDGVGGVRIEDEILVTADGCEVLTSFPKSLSDLIVPLP